MLGAIFIAAVISYYLKGMEFTLALLYGGAITVTSTLFFAWRLKIATKVADNNEPGTPDSEQVESGLAPQKGVNAGVLFQGIILRLVMVIVLLAVGMGVLELDPLGMLIGFGLPMTAYWFSGPSYGQPRRK